MQTKITERESCIKMYKYLNDKNKKWKRINNSGGLSIYFRHR